MSIEKLRFGMTSECKVVELYTIKNSAGAEAEILTYGGTLQALKMPDKLGNISDVLIGFDTLEEHLERSAYQGQLVGRYANRIAGGEFKINGNKYSVTKNEKGITCLHG